MLTKAKNGCTIFWNVHWFAEEEVCPWLCMNSQEPTACYSRTLTVFCRAVSLLYYFVGSSILIQGPLWTLIPQKGVCSCSLGFLPLVSSRCARICSISAQRRRSAEWWQISEILCSLDLGLCFLKICLDAALLFQNHLDPWMLRSLVKSLRSL